ncbi:hypothetical protein PTKIN_Ptkin02bG0116500 [Pterospermum kingtungense]
MDVDLSKALLSKFRLRRIIHRIEYEALHMICFQCGKYGHQKEDCNGRMITLNTKGILSRKRRRVELTLR